MNTVIEVKSVRYTQHEHIIDMDVLFKEFEPNWLPYSAELGNTEGNGDDLYTRAMAGEFGPIAPYVAPDPEPEQPAVPVTSVSLAQARAGLILRGLFDSVVAHIEAIEDPVQRELARNDFAHRNEVEVGYPLVGEIKAMLAWTDEQVLEFFAFCHSL